MGTPSSRDQGDRSERDNWPPEAKDCLTATSASLIFAKSSSSNTGREWQQRLNSYKAIIIIFAYVAIFVFLSLSFSRLILELRKNVVLAYFNQGVAQLFFLGLYI